MKREELIQKWLNDELNSEEKKAFDGLKDFDLLKEIVNEAPRFKYDAGSTDAIFEKVNEVILNENQKKSTKWIGWASSIAAAVLISFFIFQTFEDSTLVIRTELSENKEIYLPDSSLVKLNALSEVSYKSSNWDANRKLSLKGEAFFDVEKGNTFDVETSAGIVSVLGTEFNVKVTDSIFEVICYEGSVKVQGANFSEVLKPGQRFNLDSNKSSVRSIYLSEPSWVNNMSVYKNAPLMEVLSGLENEFNVDIQKSIKNKDLLFSGAFYHDNLSEALKVVTAPLNLTFEILSNDQVVIKDHGE